MADFILSFLFSGGLISVIIIIAVIALFFNFVPLGLWISAIAAGVNVGIFNLIQGPANDLQHGTWVIILAQQGREQQGKQNIRKFLCGKLLRERIRTNLCIPLQDRTQAR